jgi:hypothetical protein
MLDHRLEALSEDIDVVRDMIGRSNAASLRRRPASGEWSAHDVVCHLLLNEINTASTIRRMITEDCPVLAEIDDGRVDRFSAIYPDTDSAFATWRILREDTIRLAASLSDAEVERVGVSKHATQEFTRTVRQYLVERVRHDREHIDQMRSALGAE